VSYASEQAKQGPCYISQAKEQHIKLSEYTAHIRALETELAKRPVLEQGSGMQYLREELAIERSMRFKRQTEARHVILTMGKLMNFPIFSFTFSAGREVGSNEARRGQDRRARVDPL
jgi:hypothetical protein